MRRSSRSATARRRSELAGLDFQRRGEGEGALKVSDGRLELRLARSKGNATGEPEIYVVPRANNADAFRAIQAWLSAARIRPGEPVFRRVHKSGSIGRARLDPQSVSLAIRQRIRAHLVQHGAGPTSARTQAAAFSSHSLRVGFAVSAAEAGADIGAIQQALGHATPAMAMRYARAAERHRTSPHRLEGGGLQEGARRNARRPWSSARCRRASCVA